MGKVEKRMGRRQQGNCIWARTKSPGN